MKEETVQCDVLCAGGGIAGLMAAIRASELGASVVVAEKGNVEYSGCGRSGNDHFETYIPEVHGDDKEAFIRVPTLLLLFVNVLFGIVWAMLSQRVSLTQTLAAATTGFESTTGIVPLDQVLSRGGMTSMESVIILVLMAGALGGSLRATGVLDALVAGIVRCIRTSGSLIAAVLIACYIVIFLRETRLSP